MSKSLRNAAEPAFTKKNSNALPPMILRPEGIGCDRGRAAAMDARGADPPGS